MKKTIITLLISLSLAASLSAQTKDNSAVRKNYFVYGPKIGLSAPNQNAVTNTTEIDKLLNGFNTGVQLGGYARGMLPIKKIMVLYMQLDALYAMDFYWGGSAHASAGCFNFPVTVGGGYKFKNGLFLRGGWGPTYTINLYSTATTQYSGDDYRSDVADMLRRDPWGFAADLGFDYKNIAIDLRFMNQFRSQSVTRIADEYRYVSWGLTVGYRF